MKGKVYMDGEVGTVKAQITLIIHLFDKPTIRDLESEHKLDFRESKAHYAVIKDQFGYIGPDGQSVRVAMPGTEFAGYDLSNVAKVGIKYKRAHRDSRVWRVSQRRLWRGWSGVRVLTVSLRR
jgi:hypothetical protein